MTIFKKYEIPQSTEKFRNTLIQIRGHKCEKCGLTHWLGQLITLELHHIDGDKSNNKLENLQLLCPNCHSYTPNFGSKNKKHNEVSDNELIQALSKSYSIRQALISVGLSDAGTNYNRARTLINNNKVSLLTKKLQPKENFCIDCGKPIYPTAIRCVECNKKYQISLSNFSTINREELKNLIRTKPFTQIGKKFGVSDNTIRKWCDKYNLPKKSSDIKSYSDKEWELI